jgi:hypothetical protein
LQPANRDHGDSSFRHGDSGTAAGPVLQMAQRTGLLAKIGPDYILPTTPARSGTVWLTADRAGTADLRPGHSQADRLSSRIPPHVMALAAHLPEMRRMQGRSPGPFVPGGRAPAGMWLRDGVTSSERAGRAARRLVPAPWRRSPPPTAAPRAAQHGGRPRSLFVLLPYCGPYRLHFTGMSCGRGIQRDPGTGPSVPVIGLCSATLAAAGRHGDQADPHLEASQATGRADVVIPGLRPHHETDGARLRAARPHLSYPATGHRRAG